MFVGALGCHSAQDPVPPIHAEASLANARAAILAGNAPSAAAHGRLIERANEALTVSPAPPVDFQLPGFYEDAAAHDAGKRALRIDANAAYETALAAALGVDLPAAQRSAYRAKAIEVLDAWARRNRAVSGVGEYREQSHLTMAVVGTAFVLAADLLGDQEGWAPGDPARRRFDLWVERVFRPAAARMFERTNNKAAWALFAAAAADAYLGDRAGLEDVGDRLAVLIEEQIDATGALPAELRRDERSLWYTYWALAPVTNAAEIVRVTTGRDLFSRDSESGRRLESATSFFFRGARDPGTWPTAVDEPAEPSGWGGNLLWALGHVYEAPHLLAWSKPPFRRMNSAWKSVDLLPPAPVAPARRR